MPAPRNEPAFLTAMFEPRTYRKWVSDSNLTTFNVSLKETDLSISAEKVLKEEALGAIKKSRGKIEQYALKNPYFLKALKPLDAEEDAPLIIKKMAEASRLAGVGPMAAVAGAISEYVAKDLNKYSEEVIVENGGDIYICGKKDKTIAVYAASSPLSGKLKIHIKANKLPISICTSSGNIGHSISFGKADAAVAIAKSGSLADAAATAIGNMVKAKEDIAKAIENAKQIFGLLGVLIILGGEMGVWGDIELSA